MSERERFLKLILQYSGTEGCKKASDSGLVDYLLNQGVIVPPVKVGDTVWDNDFGCPESYIVTGLDFGKTLDDEVEHKELFVYCQNWNGSVTFSAPASLFGKNVFLNREDAEKALAERSELNDA